MAKRAKKPNCDCVRSIRYAENLKKDLCADCEQKNKINEKRISSLEKKVTAFMLLFAVTATIVGKDIMNNAGETVQAIQELEQKAESAVEELPKQIVEVPEAESKDETDTEKAVESPKFGPVTQSNSGGTLLPDSFGPKSTSSNVETDKSMIAVVRGDTKSLMDVTKPTSTTTSLVKLESLRLSTPIDGYVSEFEPPEPRAFVEDLSPNYYPIPSPSGILILGMGFGFVRVRPRR